MNKNYLLSTSLVLLATLFCGCDESGNYWQRMAQQDLDFMRAQILENHPGPVNVEDPHFAQNLETAYQNALNAITTIIDHDGYETVVKSFVTSFHDSHLRICPLKKKEKAVKKEKPDPKKLVAFDEIAPKVAWIRIPTFELGEEQKDRLAEMFKMLVHLRHYKAIVFDLHGNAGGNPAWGGKIISELFSPSYSQQQRYELWEKIALDYRVSPGNLLHIKKIAQSCAKDFGKESELARGYDEFYQIMKTAAERGDKLVRVPKGEYKPRIKQVPNPVTAAIFVIIDHACVSACLDFIDELKQLKHPVILFGEQTGADTFYTEVLSEKLPSGQGMFTFPIKVYRGRLRGNNEAYKPDVAYSGDLNDTPRVAEAVYRLIRG